ncbi:MAG: response regulator transcription factor [Chloroflexi bacterium]|jgi:DNA-binding NarL/FixJ family response regulator|nr:response regulator transcription factor [Chloroflexota bacterium]
MSMIRVLLVDDHPVVRLGIRHLLEGQPDIVVVGEAGDGFEAMDMVKKLSPDVLLLDMEMPGMNGYDVVNQLKAEGISIPILVLSAYDDRQYIQELLRSGASGYLVKEELPETLIEAVRGVARGERGWVSRRVAVQMTNWMMKSGEEIQKLTAREVDVIKGVVAGKTNQEIGFQLDISEKTVEKHLRSVFHKLQVTSRVEAAVRAVQAGLVPPAGENGSSSTTSAS